MSDEGRANPIAFEPNKTAFDVGYKHLMK